MNRRDKTINPFIDSLYDVKLKTKTIVSKKGGMVETVDTETGEVRAGFYQALIREKKQEKITFVKIYPDFYEVAKKLDKAATLMLMYFLSNLGYKDTVALNMQKAKEFTGYKSDKSIYKAISALKSHKVIANHYRNGIYYINPMLFYRGDRLKLIEIK